ncbi:YeeE/YedE family protein [Serratia quinivorans]|uniref:YeeE/YedE family protein n=1 Tax=Serratia quinivorans TaxID=137545 RepID=UPI002178B37F|nr:YeeE/YedE family protein [Serratia quinivorans]CAI0855031.1 Predicted transporter component [Serratia quinivorans]CAI0877728.1 Predicted transporter component [Serratia quinivorans]CAI0903062.1 Predicted transporter component [Serratia quinivorans]CAI1508081.1 Predicted transporter component [Serratia quinivorans]CAI2053456.1 Predicted transporter component [Serratia quinivorans]
MTIDWLHFTPFSALAGGSIIGVAVVLLLLFNGRIAGISGITGGLLTPQGKEKAWRIAFLVGLLASPWLYGIAAPLPTMAVSGNSLWLILAGLLVGLGTRLGGGCTSGHGVCGTARLAPRSLAATVVFMLLGFATVWAVRHWIGG